jgi:hypothetical protein
MVGVSRGLSKGMDFAVGPLVPTSVSHRTHASALVARRRCRVRAGGSVYVETLITLPVVIFMFFTSWQVIDMLTAATILRHAAIVAARSAAVVGPDEGYYYGDQPVGDIQSGNRNDDIVDAVSLVLRAEPHFRDNTFTLDLSGDLKENTMVTAKLSAPYYCLFPYLNAVCGGQSYRMLSAQASFPYQAANVDWEH